MDSLVNATRVIQLAAGFGFTGVLLGAFGAHGLKDVLSGREQEIWKTAVFYHLIHAVVLLSLGLTGRASKATTICFSVGIGLFAGSLYLLAVTEIGWLGAITPLGGICFLLGWAFILGKVGVGHDASIPASRKALNRSGQVGEAADNDAERNHPAQ